MPRVCTVCTHKKRKAIDRELVAGTTFRNIAKRYGLSITALVRHRDDHLPETLIKAKEAEDKTHAEDLLERFDALLNDARRIGKKAESAENYSAALAGVREMVRINELLLEVRGKLDRRAQVSVVVSSEWTSIRTAILKALEPYPDARAAVVEALKHAIPND